VATTLLVARHGETDWNLERRWQGHAESDLSAKGRAQAQALGEQLRERGLAAIYSSDLRRARDTAGIVGSELGLPVRVEQALREVDVGEWSGLTTDEIEARYPEGVARRRSGGTGWEQGESVDAMSARIAAALIELAVAHDGETVLVVTHGGPIREVRRVAGLTAEGWHHVGNCEVDELEVREGQIRWLDSTRGGLHQQVQG
jgi:broad specificity phosphatase PhoE